MTPIRAESAVKAGEMEVYVGDISNVLLQIPFRLQRLFHFQPGLYMACPSLSPPAVCIPTHTHAHNSRPRRPMKPPVFYDCFKIHNSLHFCLSSEHRDLF